MAVTELEHTVSVRCPCKLGVLSKVSLILLPREGIADLLFGPNKGCFYKCMVYGIIRSLLFERWWGITFPWLLTIIQHAMHNIISINRGKGLCSFVCRIYLSSWSVAEIMTIAGTLLFLPNILRFFIVFFSYLSRQCCGNHECSLHSYSVNQRLCRALRVT